MDYKKISEKFPFLSIIKYQDEETLCIIQNHDEKVMSFYDLTRIKSKETRKKLLDLGDIWWWESNRILPINIFLPDAMKEFQPFLVTVSMKDVEVLLGPVTSLSNLLTKRIKRRQIQLVRKVD